MFKQTPRRGTHWSSTNHTNLANFIFPRFLLDWISFLSSYCLLVSFCFFHFRFPVHLRIPSFLFLSTRYLLERIDLTFFLCPKRTSFLYLFLAFPSRLASFPLLSIPVNRYETSDVHSFLVFFIFFLLLLFATKYSLPSFNIISA